MRKMAVKTGLEAMTKPETGGGILELVSFGHCGAIAFESLTIFSTENLTIPAKADIIRAFTFAGAGEAFDLEREEVLGDSFLKVSASVYLYFTQQSLVNEGFLTQMKSKIVGNKNLFHQALVFHLDRFLITEKFEPHRNWRPLGFVSKDNVEAKIREMDERERTRNLYAMPSRRRKSASKQSD